MEKTITICNLLGLHMRAASKLVQLANEFEVDVMLDCNGAQADAKSLLEVLQLAGTKGSDVTISVEGDAEEDEEPALLQICQLFDSRFGEPE